MLAQKPQIPLPNDGAGRIWEGIVSKPLFFLLRRYKAPKGAMRIVGLVHLTQVLPPFVGVFVGRIEDVDAFMHGAATLAPVRRCLFSRVHAPLSGVNMYVVLRTCSAIAQI